METDSSVVYHGTNESLFPSDETKGRKQLQLSQDEMRILRECNRDSFYYRCLPLAVSGMAAAYLGVKNGFLRSHPRWGPAGKMMGAAVFGWFVGKVSYRSTCEDKFLRLPNSAIGEAVRKRRGLPLDGFDRDESLKTREFDDYSLKDNSDSLRNDDYNSSSRSLNLDVDKNVPYSGLDDRERPTTDKEDIYPEINETPQRFTSHEELRRRNRDSYERQYQPPPSTQSEPIQSNTRRLWDRSEIKNDAPKNAYGDLLDK